MERYCWEYVSYLQWKSRDLNNDDTVDAYAIYDRVLGLLPGREIAFAFSLDLAEKITEALNRCPSSTSQVR